MQVRNATLVHLPLVNVDDSGNIAEHTIGLKLNTGDGEITASNPYTIDIDWHAIPAPHAEEVPQSEPAAVEVDFIEDIIPEEEPEVSEEEIELSATVPPVEAPVMIKSGLLSNLGDYIWFIYAGIFIVLALVILLIVLLSGKRRKKQAQKMDGWGEGPAFNSVWDSESAYDFVESAAAVQAVSRMEEASQMGYGSSASAAVPGHTPATERIGQQPQPGYTPATQRLAPQNGAYGANIGLSASSGTVRLAPKETGIKILIEESRRVAGVFNTRYVYLEKTLIFGRNFDCDYIVQDEATSGEHFKISREVDGIYITDLKSSNGTLVNGRHIHESCALRSEDVIKVGNTTLRVRFEL